MGVLIHMEDFNAWTCVCSAFTHKFCSPSAQALPSKEVLAASPWPLQMPLMKSDLPGRVLWFKETIYYLLDSTQADLYHWSIWTTYMSEKCLQYLWFDDGYYPDLADLDIHTMDCDPLKVLEHFGGFGVVVLEALVDCWNITALDFPALCQIALALQVLTKFCTVPSQLQLYYCNVVEEIRAVQHLLEVGSCCNISAM